MSGTTGTQRPGRLRQGRSGGQHVVHQQAADTTDAGPPPRLDLHRVLKVGGALPVVEPGLVGHTPPKSQGRRENDLTVAAGCQCQGGTSHQCQRRVPAPADSGAGRRYGNDEHRPVARGQHEPEAGVGGQRRRHRQRKHRRQNPLEVPAVGVLEGHEGQARRGAIRCGGPDGRAAGRTGSGEDLPRAPGIAPPERRLRTVRAPACAGCAASATGGRERHLKRGQQ
jgi:hypothetical protein